MKKKKLIEIFWVLSPCNFSCLRKLFIALKWIRGSTVLDPEIFLLIKEAVTTVTWAMFCCQLCCTSLEGSWLQDRLNYLMDFCCWKSTGPEQIQINKNCIKKWFLHDFELSEVLFWNLKFNINNNTYILWWSWWMPFSTFARTVRSEKDVFSNIAECIFDNKGSIIKAVDENILEVLH